MSKTNAIPEVERGRHQEGSPSDDRLRRVVHAALALRDADLQLYTKTVPGRQSLRGLASGQVVQNPRP